MMQLAIFSQKHDIHGHQAGVHADSILSGGEN